MTHSRPSAQLRALLERSWPMATAGVGGAAGLLAGTLSIVLLGQFEYWAALSAAAASASACALFLWAWRRLVRRVRREEERATEELSEALKTAAEQREMQYQAVLADRVGSLGTLSAGIAHEMNNPLAVVMANLELLADMIHDGRSNPATEAEIQELLRDAHDAGERIRKIILSLKVFSRPDDGNRVPVSLPAVLDFAAGAVKTHIRQKATLVREYAEVPMVVGSEALLAQVFVNLLINASQALGSAAPEHNRIRLVIRRHSASRVAVEVHDTGKGIQPEVLPRVFEPFFTTKPVGMGTGLGLSVCHGIVASHGGEMEVRSTPGVGTVVRVLLPPSQAAEGPTLEEPSPIALPAEAKRVLVVDDEPQVARALRRVLERSFRVEEFTSPVAALERLRAGGEFDAILCDLMMPDLSGVDLYRELERDKGELARRVIFITAASLTPETELFLRGIPNRVLSKPLSAQALTDAISGLTAAESLSAPASTSTSTSTPAAVP